jgi:5-formyltetrahydrofolate cyclo-ligase
MIPTREFRLQLRAQRGSLPPQQRQHAAQELAKRAASLMILARAHHVGGYFAFDGEMDPEPLLARVLAMGKCVHLPVLFGKDRLRFAPYRPGDALKPNRFGIPEPDLPHGELLPPTHLDLVFTPLVAFDARGTRLGMGGGFYDRSFAFLNNPAHLPKPRLIGLAFELQKVVELPRQPWDIPLDGIVTEAAVYPGDGKSLD